MKKHMSATAFALVVLGLGSVLAQPRQAPGGRRAQRHPPNPVMPPRPSIPPLFGEPLPGLTPQQLLDFAAGREEFEHEEAPEGGLGPIFNNVSCVACHSAPATGGSSDLVVTRFGRRVNGGFDPLDGLGGSLLQQFAIVSGAEETVPVEANVMAHRQSTPLFGLGLIEAIPDQDLRRLAAQPKPDGVRGRVSELVDVTTGTLRVGHFGWKAQQATLLAFAGDAYLNEMGITSRFFPHENAPNGNTTLLELVDDIEDPEDEVDPVTGKGDIDAAADFMRYLAPPTRLPLMRMAREGERWFGQVGCAVCHTPVLQTGRSPVGALDRQPVNLFSDLLLHDMGALGDGIAQGSARPREMKTAPLWGLRASAPYLHDGRAATIDEAIRAHDGEGRVARDRYLKLNAAQRSQLLEFLNSI